MTYSLFENILWKATCEFSYHRFVYQVLAERHNTAGQINRWRVQTLHLPKTDLDHMEQKKANVNCESLHSCPNLTCCILCSRFRSCTTSRLLSVRDRMTGGKLSPSIPDSATQKLKDERISGTAHAYQDSASTTNTSSVGGDLTSNVDLFPAYGAPRNATAGFWTTRIRNGRPRRT